MGGRDPAEERAQPAHPLPAPTVTLEPSPSSPQQDPRWTPLEDMEVFSPDAEDATGSKRSNASNTTAAPPPGPPLSPSGKGGALIKDRFTGYGKTLGTLVKINAFLAILLHH